MTILSYNGQNITQRQDGFVNATQMCSIGNKKVNDWLRLEQTKAYIKGIAIVTGIPDTDLIVIKQGGSYQNQGTWIHPRLAIELGRWISVDFAIWCDQHIKTLIETGSTQLIQTPPKKAIAYYTDRIMDLKHSLIKPPGTWCVIEKCSHLLLEVERLGYQVNQFDLLDGSVGSRWGKYRKGKSWSCVGHKATYKFPDNRGERIINAYEYPEIGEFMTWLDYSYETRCLPEYLEEKYSAIVKVS